MVRLTNEERSSRDSYREGVSICNDIPRIERNFSSISICFNIDELVTDDTFFLSLSLSRYIYSSRIIVSIIAAGDVSLVSLALIIFKISELSYFLNTKIAARGNHLSKDKIYCSIENLYP